ncbi:LysR family transcriptional regulator [Parvibaculum sp.]|uniref:LysR family transcriptional regulator n=1 Tax=Parvibaculum sp. TaxID=2024848 RepID=UPI0032991C8B
MNIRELDLNLLLVFNAIYTERSISNAARKLGMSQPAVSNALRRLRHFTGDTLFYKAGTGVAPTRAAMTLAIPIGHALDTVERGLSSVRNFDPSTSTRTFRIGVNDLIHDALVPALVGYARREAPNLMLEFVLQTGDMAHEAVKDGTLDMVLLPTFAINDEIGSAKVWDEPFTIIVSRQNPLAKLNRLTKDDIRSMQFVVTTHVRRLRQYVDDIFRSHGLDRTIACAVADTRSLYPLVSVSDLAAVVGRRFADQYNTDGSLVMFDAPFDLPDIGGHVAWSLDAENDEGHRWVRERVVEILASAFKLSRPTR